MQIHIQGLESAVIADEIKSSREPDSDKSAFIADENVCKYIFQVWSKQLVADVIPETKLKLTHDVANCSQSVRAAKAKTRS